MNKTLLEQARSLPAAERLQLAQELWESLLDSGHEPELTPQQAAELDRRLEEHRRHPDDVIPWEDVKADLDGKYGKRR